MPLRHRGVLAEAVEALGGQILQQGAAVEQQRLTQNGGKSLVLASADAVTHRPGMSAT
jgi:hypothetical protein